MLKFSSVLKSPCEEKFSDDLSSTNLIYNFHDVMEEVKRYGSISIAPVISEVELFGQIKCKDY